MLVSAKEMLEKAKAGHYAVGQFNINNLEWTKSVLLTAEELQSPVILGVSEGATAKSIHHGFIGGLLEHSLSVAKLCEYIAANYPVVNHDLLVTAAICHDIGKVDEISDFPQNDYTDEGQLVGHIVMGTMMIADKVREIPGFPPKLANELKHCILAHHGELEYGSPKKPALIEAMALAHADNMDAKLQTFTEIIRENEDKTEWLGFNRMFESNVRLTGEKNE